MNKIIIAFLEGYRCTKSGQALNSYGDIVLGHIANGYAIITITDSTGKKMNIPLHRLQAFQKYGHKLFEKGG